MLKLKEEASTIVPEEVKKNPFEKFMLKTDEPVKPQSVRAG